MLSAVQVAIIFQDHAEGKASPADLRDALANAFAERGISSYEAKQLVSQDVPAWMALVEIQKNGHPALTALKPQPPKPGQRGGGGFSGSSAQADAKNLIDRAVSEAAPPPITEWYDGVTRDVFLPGFALMDAQQAFIEKQLTELGEKIEKDPNLQPELGVRKNSRGAFVDKNGYEVSAYDAYVARVRDIPNPTHDKAVDAARAVYKKELARIWREAQTLGVTYKDYRTGETRVVTTDSLYGSLAQYADSPLAATSRELRMIKERAAKLDEAFGKQASEAGRTLVKTSELRAPMAADFAKSPDKYAEIARKHRQAFDKLIAELEKNDGLANKLREAVNATFSAGVRDIPTLKAWLEGARDSQTAAMEKALTKGDFDDWYGNYQGSQNNIRVLAKATGTFIKDLKDETETIKDVGTGAVLVVTTVATGGTSLIVLVPVGAGTRIGLGVTDHAIGGRDLTTTLGRDLAKGSVDGLTAWAGGKAAGAVAEGVGARLGVPVITAQIGGKAVPALDMAKATLGQRVIIGLAEMTTSASVVSLAEGGKALVIDGKSFHEATEKAGHGFVMAMILEGGFRGLGKGYTALRGLRKAPGEAELAKLVGIEGPLTADNAATTARKILERRAATKSPLNQNEVLALEAYQELAKLKGWSPPADLPIVGAPSANVLTKGAYAVYGAEDKALFELAKQQSLAGTKKGTYVVSFHSGERGPTLSSTTASRDIKVEAVISKISKDPALTEAKNIYLGTCSVEGVDVTASVAAKIAAKTNKPVVFANGVEEVAAGPGGTVFTRVIKGGKVLKAEEAYSAVSPAGKVEPAPSLEKLFGKGASYAEPVPPIGRAKPGSGEKLRDGPAEDAFMARSSDPVQVRRGNAEAQVAKRGESELEELAAQNKKGIIPERETAVVGGGFAGRGTALPGERVYDAGNFWEKVTFTKVFQTVEQQEQLRQLGYLPPSQIVPELAGSQRVPVDAMRLSSATRALDQDLAMLPGQVRLRPLDNGKFEVTSAGPKGELKEVVGDLTVATGMPPMKTTPGLDTTVRNKLYDEKKIQTGFDILRQAPRDRTGEVYVIQGRAGNAIDTSEKLINEGATVIMVGNDPSAAVKSTQAYKDWVAGGYADKAKQISGNIEAKVEGGVVTINGEKGVAVESLGPDFSRDPTSLLREAANGRTIRYEPVYGSDGQLVRADVYFGSDTVSKFHLVGTGSHYAPKGVKLGDGSDAALAKLTASLTADRVANGEGQFLEGFLQAAREGARNRALRESERAVRPPLAPMKVRE